MKTIALQQFQADATLRAADEPQRAFVRNAMGNYLTTRQSTQAEYADYPAAREAAAAVKWEALNNLERLLLEFEKNATANGSQIHWAADAESARKQILSLVARLGAKRAIKSKSMATEEIHLNEALETAGVEVVESDLGEFIQQLRNESPYHFVFPSMHLKRGEIREAFAQKFADVPADDPEALTLFARQVLRTKYLEADVGISGANFGVADCGAIAITENEGNARLTCALPAVHIVVMGIEKIIPRLEDLALLWPMLGTAGAGQLLTGYNTVYFGPRRNEEADGPTEMHIILLDNGRTKLLADSHLRDALRCIRCGACLNVCPIFQNVGGHTYGTTYQGPIGAVISPPMRGVAEFGHLAFASSLCGACTETCPVKIDLHHHLLYIRQLFTRTKVKAGERLGMKAFAVLMVHPRLYRVVSRAMLTMDGWIKPLHGTAIDPLKAWRKTRTLPAKPPKSFVQWWRGGSRS
jgi:L-lactate dehydrogenase complex protein LldF